MTFREFTGKNVEEAIRRAMAEYNADLSDLDIEILAQGSRGVLGVGGEEARILAAPKSAIAGAETLRADASDTAAVEDRPRPSRRGAVREAPAADTADEEATDATEGAPGLAPSDTERPRGGRGRGGGRAGGARGGGRDRDRTAPRAVREPRRDRPARDGDAAGPRREPTPFVPGKPIEELSEDERATLETGRTVLDEMLKLMGIEATVEVAHGADTARLNVRGEDVSALIGRRGEKLGSLQHVVNLIVGRRVGQHHRVALDVENYRGRREEQLRDVADRAAKRVLQTGKILQLEAMPAAERRIVHLALVENPRVRTQSVGVEPNRRIVVLPASQVRE